MVFTYYVRTLPLARTDFVLISPRLAEYLRYILLAGSTLEHNYRISSSRCGHMNRPENVHGTSFRLLRILADMV